MKPKIAQLPLFGTMQQPKPLFCSFGTPWLDHFDPPIGTGKGCPRCEAGQ